MKIVPFIFALVLLVGCDCAVATTYCVSPTNTPADARAVLTNATVGDMVWFPQAATGTWKFAAAQGMITNHGWVSDWFVPNGVTLACSNGATFEQTPWAVNTRVLYIGTNAVVTNATIINGSAAYSTAGGGGILAANGAQIWNCIITNCTGPAVANCGAGVSGFGGTTNSASVYNTTVAYCYASINASYGAVANMNVVSNCVVATNNCGGVVRSVSVWGGSISNNYGGGGAYLVSNLVGVSVIGNTTGFGGGGLLSCGRADSCVLAFNTNNNTSYSGGASRYTTLAHCTVVSNGCAGGLSAISGNGAVNCIVFGNTPAVNFGNGAWSSNNYTNAVAFTNGDWVPPSNSVTIDADIYNGFWAASNTNTDFRAAQGLTSQGRKVGAQVDQGAVEWWSGVNNTNVVVPSGIPWRKKLLFILGGQ